MKDFKCKLTFLRYYVISKVIFKNNYLPQGRGKLLQHLGYVVTPLYNSTLSTVWPSQTLGSHVSGGIGVRDQFRLGGLRSVARIFYPLLARKSSGLPEYYMIFARKLLFEKF